MPADDALSAGVGDGAWVGDGVARAELGVGDAVGAGVVALGESVELAAESRLGAAVIAGALVGIGDGDGDDASSGALSRMAEIRSLYSSSRPMTSASERVGMDAAKAVISSQMSASASCCWTSGADSTVITSWLATDAVMHWKHS